MPPEQSALGADSGVALSIAVLTVSDTRTWEDDASGAVLVDLLGADGHTLAERAIVKDDRQHLHSQLTQWVARSDIQVILTTGGTGLTGRDVTPEVVESLASKMIPGFGELFRMQSAAKIGASTIQSRATAVLAGGTLIFALPGSPGACRDAWCGILRSQLDSRHRPCNFVELMDRFEA